jgi:hypothetical protein
MSIAAASETLTVSRRTASRPPGNRNRCAYRTPAGATTATHTVPAGFPRLPPAGPRNTGDGDRKVRPEEGEDPFRHRKRHLAAHRSPRDDQFGRNAQQRDLRGIAVRHDAAGKIEGAAGDRGDRSPKQPPRARFRHGEGPPGGGQRRSQELRRRGGQPVSQAIPRYASPAHTPAARSSATT